MRAMIYSTIVLILFSLDRGSKLGQLKDSWGDAILIDPADSDYRQELKGLLATAAAFAQTPHTDREEPKFKVRRLELAKQIRELVGASESDAAAVASELKEWAI